MAYRVLSWISYEFRPMSLIELQYALAVREDMTNIDKDDLDDEEFLISICAGLVTVSGESRQVGLVRECSVQMSLCAPYPRKQIIQLRNIWKVFGAQGLHFFVLPTWLSAVSNICPLTCLLIW